MYTTREALDEHIRQSHRSPLIICPMCQKSLPSGQSLKKHVQSCHYQVAGVSSVASMFVKQETRVSNLGISSNDATSFDCLPCQKSYKTQSGLIFHNKTKHQVTVKVVMCWKKPVSKQNLIRTLSTSVSTVENLFRGPQTSKDTLKQYTP